MKNLSRPIGVRAAGGVLDQIVEAKVKRLEHAKRISPVNEIVEKALDSAALRPISSFAGNLSRPGRVNVIAETKYRSPSKGVIRPDFDPLLIAQSYSRAGAAALSVLAEEDFFGGSLDHLAAIRKDVDLPLLRKDFIFDDYQIYESVVAGANAVLLIVAMLEEELLARLLALANELGLDALVEVHSAGEMERAANAEAKIIGVNNRDLTTFKVELSTSARLAPLAPRDAILVSESGINSAADIDYLKAAGFQAFLIGEHFMRANDPGEALQSLIAGCEFTSST